MALLGSLDRNQALPAFAQVEEAVKKLPDSNIRDVLLSQLATANGSLTQLRDDVAKWFDDAMDRLAGQYKRRMRFYTFWIGVLLVAVLNADTFLVAQALWKDGTLREAIVKAADRAVAVEPPSVSGAGSRDLGAALDNLRKAAEATRPLPLGWDDAQRSEMARPGLGWPVKLLGWLLTAFALSLGAPFWFDVLSKFMRVRGAGDKPERT